jgi:hypothetical protein
MNRLFGLVFVIVGIAHAWHVATLKAGDASFGSIGRPLSFANLDRIALSGLWGTVAILLIDAVIVWLGVSIVVRDLRRQAPPKPLTHGRAKKKHRARP